MHFSPAARTRDFGIQITERRISIQGDFCREIHVVTHVGPLPGRCAVDAAALCRVQPLAVDCRKNLIRDFPRAHNALLRVFQGFSLFLQPQIMTVETLRFLAPPLKTQVRIFQKDAVVTTPSTYEAESQGVG